MTTSTNDDAGAKAFEAKRKANRDAHKALRAAFKNGEAFPGAKWFIWGNDTLYYGSWKEKTAGCLSGNCVQVLTVDAFGGLPGSKRFLRELCKMLNDQSVRIAKAVGSE